MASDLDSSPLSQYRAEVLIIGAGVIGSAVALQLALRGHQDILVVDVDMDGTHSSSELNAGGVRATFNQELNIQMSKLTIDYLAEHAENVGYRPCGYLWLQDEARMQSALRARERQMAAGWPVEAWDLDRLRRERPFLDRASHLVGAIFAPRDGLVNPNLLKLHLRNEAKCRGVRFLDRTWIESASYPSKVEKNRFAQVQARRLPALMSEEAKTRFFAEGAGVQSAESKAVRIEAQRIVNCAGAWAGVVAQRLGYSSPVFPVRRQISIFDCRDVDLSPYGMFIDSSGVYFHPEATNGLAGFATRNEKPGFNFAYDGDDFFNSFIWPHLYELSSGFDRLRHLTGWGGLYEVSPDETAVLGKVELGQAGEFGSVFEAHSFSGHGVMHCHAAGIALAELMSTGKFQTLDVSPLSASRFATGQLLHESQVI